MPRDITLESITDLQASISFNVQRYNEQESALEYVPAVIWLHLRVAAASGEELEFTETAEVGTARRTAMAPRELYAALGSSQLTDALQSLFRQTVQQALAEDPGTGG